MPVSGRSTAANDKKSRVQSKVTVTNVGQDETSASKTFLTIGPALPSRDSKKVYKRAHSTLTSLNLIKNNDKSSAYDTISIQTCTNGKFQVLRTPKEKEKNPDRISLDRRGLNVIPVIHDEPKLRLLSLQHNLINSLESLQSQDFRFLVFLDIYDNQLETISCLDELENLRVLLLGKNRIKRIEGLTSLTKIEVLDLHGNQIANVSGLETLSELKVLNLAGNQIRHVGVIDLQGLSSLQELNLRRNRIRKLLCFNETPNLQKLFVSNNELQSVEDMTSIAKSTNLKEISIDNNPVSLAGDCISFLVSYLPHLVTLNNMQVTEQVRKAAMTWRRNKESSNAAFLDLTSDVCLHVRREEVISNARTNWELLRSQTKCFTTKTHDLNVRLENDFVLTAFGRIEKKTTKALKVPSILDKRTVLTRTSSQDTENSQNTSSSTASTNEFFRLPPILVPIINKMEQKNSLVRAQENRISDSLSSIGPNVDSSVSSLMTSDRTSTDSSSSDDEVQEINVDSSEEVNKIESDGMENRDMGKLHEIQTPKEPIIKSTTPSILSETARVVSPAIPSIVTPPSTEASNSSGKSLKQCTKILRNIKSAVNTKTNAKQHPSTRAVSAKPKKRASPIVAPINRDREQGGDYLIEICGRHLNIYGQGAIRFIDKAWSQSKAGDVTTVKFNYTSFNGITGMLGKLKQKFPNADHFYFKETNIQYLGQLNALAEIQGLTSLYIDPEGNPITEKKWQSYAVYRLSHWGLKILNGKEITDEDVKAANEEYQSLSDLVLWSLPDILLQPLLLRLRLDVNESASNHNAKKWLLKADPALRNVVTKEALQWKKGGINQEDIVLRQKARFYIGSLLNELSNTVNKLRILDRCWPSILQEAVCNTLVDYSQLDRYMKEKLQELQ